MASYCSVSVGVSVGVVPRRHGRAEDGVGEATGIEVSWARTHLATYSTAPPIISPIPPSYDDNSWKNGIKNAMCLLEGLTAMGPGWAPTTTRPLSCVIGAPVEARNSSLFHYGVLERRITPPYNDAACSRL